jgi:cobalt/nickel transport system permease protein
MAGVHMLIGIGEGLITGLVLAGIARTRPELLRPDGAPARARSYGAVAAYGTLIALALVLFVSPFASSWPDGLERTAEHLGFEGRAAAVVAAPLPDYVMPGVSWSAAATSIAGAVGTVVVFVLAWVLARVLARRGGGAAAGSIGEDRD